MKEKPLYLQGATCTCREFDPISNNILCTYAQANRYIFPFFISRQNDYCFGDLDHSQENPDVKNQPLIAEKQTSYFSFFLHKCTFWAQFFSTWMRVNCGQISQKFPKISQNFPKFLHTTIFLHKYNLWYLWQIWALFPAGVNTIGGGGKEALGGAFWWIW